MALNNLTRVTGSGFGTETSINTAGIITAASFSGDGSSLTGVVGSGSGVVIREEGSNVGTAQTINFVGTGVTATISGAVATIEITSSGGGGGGSGISSIFEDTTPRLGGNLDANSKEITGTGNVNLAGISTFGSTNISSLSVGAALDITSTNSASTIQANNSSQPFYIQGLNNSLISILAGTGSQGRVTLYNQGKVEIAHAGSKKFETTSTGAEITGNLTATSFSGDVTGTATTATNVTVADESSDTSCFLLYSTEATGNIAPKTGSNLTFNSSSGTLTASTFVGDGSGLTGITASGSGVIVRDGGSLVGTAGTIDFGTNVSVSPISAGVVTVTAAAGTITGINTSGTTELNNLTIAGVSTFQGDVNLGDSDKILLGSDNDFEIYHDGSDGYIDNSTGELYIRDTNESGTNRIFIQPKSGVNAIIAREEDNVELYFNNSKKFETTGIGITVTGTTFTNNLSVSGITTLAGGLHIGRQVVSSDASSSMLLGGASGNQGINFTGLNSSDSNSTYYKNIRVNKVGGGFRYDLEFHSNGYSSGDIGDFIFYRRQTSSGRAERMRLSGQTGNLNVVGIVTASSFKGSGATLTTLNASELDSGTIPDARFPATLPAISGANLTNLPSPTPADTDVQVTYDVSSNGSSGYRFTGPGYSGADDNPDIYLVRGQRYRFINGTGSGHPFRIQSDTSGTAYTDGVSGSQSGTQDFNVQHDAPVRLYYQCTIHSGMIGNIYVVGASDWRITDVATNATPEIFTNLNVGIGTEDPSVKLHVQDSTASKAYFSHPTSNRTTLYIESDDTSARVGSTYLSGGSAFKPLDFLTSGQTRLRIESGGNTDVKRGLRVSGEDAAWGSGSEGAFMDYYAAGSMVRLGHVNGASGSAKSIVMYTGGSEKLRIESGGDVKINNGDLIFTTAGKGVSFINAADTATGETVGSSVLDDYEEGTFTPTVSVEGQGNATTDKQYGRYVKVGKMVTVWCYVQLNGTPSGRGVNNAWQHGGLPFTKMNNASGFDTPGAIIYWTIDSTSALNGTAPYMLVARIFNNSTGGRIRAHSSGSNQSGQNASLLLKDNTEYSYTFTYEVA